MGSINQLVERDQVSAVYKMVCLNEHGNDPDSVQKRVELIRWLEKTLKTEFKSTEDFHQKVRNRLEGYKGNPGRRLKRARKAVGMLQDELAAFLNCDRSFIAKMERADKVLSPAAITFIELAENGVSKAEIFNFFGHIEKSKKSANSFKINNLHDFEGQK